MTADTKPHSKAAEKYKKDEVGDAVGWAAADAETPALEHKCMSWSLLLINPLFGILALLYSSKTRNANRCGRPKDAHRYSRVTCCVIVLGLLVTMAVLAVLGVYLANLLIDMRLRREAAGGCDPSLCNLDTPCLKTKSGCIRGKAETVELADGRKGRVRAFLGVPFAKPPVGNLRFEDPQAPKPWGSRVLDTMHYGRSCHGTIDETYPGFKGAEMWNPPGGKANLSEDCLYLNIWLPEERETATLPFMIWIYGGGYFSGTASLDVYRGQFLALAQNVIVASMNYRVGSLGFLTTGDGRIKGNYGLSDQRQAVAWLHENLDVLGADPETVTLMGESAGAASVGYHIVNKQTSKYFKRAIMHSASQLSPWAVIRPTNAAVRAQKLFQVLGCDAHTDVNRTLQCLRGIDADQFVAKDWIISNTMFFPWAPVQDGDFITSDPLIDLQTRTIDDKDVIFSSNKDEGTFWLVYNFPGQFTKDKEWVKLSAKDVKADFDVLTADLPKGNEKDVLYQEYSAHQEAGNTTRNAKLADLILGDRHFTCPAEYFGEVFTQGRNKYYLQYYYRDSLESWPEWFGVIHGADCQWLFGIPLDKQLNYLTSEVKLADQITRYYANFARTGNPNSEGLVSWPQYNKESKPVLRFAPNGEFKATKFDDEFYSRSRACAKWNQIERISTCCNVP